MSGIRRFTGISADLSWSDHRRRLGRWNATRTFWLMLRQAQHEREYPLGRIPPLPKPRGRSIRWTCPYIGLAAARPAHAEPVGAGPIVEDSHNLRRLHPEVRGRLLLHGPHGQS